MLIGERLKVERKRKKLTLKEVSKETGVSLPFLSDIERGEAKPSIKTLEKLAAFYHLQIAQLLVDAENSQIEKVFPKELLELKEAEGISDDWMNTLISVQYRGNQPKTKEEWQLLYLNLKSLLDK